MKNFEQPISQKLLDITNKKRANLLTWRGQFSPQLIETILKEYCLPDSVILDPFSGSGTVLLEASFLGFEAYGIELNPAAWLLSKTYELINNYDRKISVNKMRKILDQEFPFRILNGLDEEIKNFDQKLLKIRNQLSKELKILFDALIISLDVGSNKVTNELIQCKFNDLVRMVESLPYSHKLIKVYLSDARSLPIENNKIDFIVTSPPYINVFNYHQNYRKSAEMLGWNLLKIAKSEIGSNRANRGNRFYTVIQYCLDMADTLGELSRVCNENARVVFIIGHQSNVLGVPFYNSDIIERIATESGLFKKALRQKRSFKNKFGTMIREDIINFSNLGIECKQESLEKIARETAYDILKQSLTKVSSKNKIYLDSAIEKVNEIKKTPRLDIMGLGNIIQ
ncbi:DNA methyltransferase [Cyanothece sp. BG0011]|uniref:DNA methyltransferase n=1 Tax=Cyanothece sp. BG0011 TaxID=2082950 RepID=UPI000D1E0CC0|nr:DNA methyltransferase [Cyanothece sp. BG0011]